MLKPYRVTRVHDKIAVVLYHKSGKIAHQGFITIADIDRLQPLFRRYLTAKDTNDLNQAIRDA